MHGMPLLITLLFAVSCLAPFPVEARQRLAISFGIDTYSELPALQKARNDANALGSALRRLRFDARVVTDPDRLKLLSEWDLFLSRISPGDTVAVFFAGHAVQLDGANFLLARDTPKAAHGQEVLRAYGVSLSRMVDAVRARKPDRAIFIFDACRDDPFVAAGTRSAAAAVRGLAGIDAAGGEFIMYSAAAGEQALDGLHEKDDHPNSVYTRHLLPLIENPSLSVLQVAKELQSKVSAAARNRTDPQGRPAPHRQRPAYYDGIEGEFFLSRSDGQLGQPVRTSAAQPEIGTPKVKTRSPGSMKGATVHLPLHDDPAAQEIRNRLREVLPTLGVQVLPAADTAEYVVRTEVTVQRSETIGQRRAVTTVRLRCRNAANASAICPLDGLSVSGDGFGLNFARAETESFEQALDQLNKKVSAEFSTP